jgi:hypothetical protein
LNSIPNRNIPKTAYGLVSTVSAELVCGNCIAF